MYQFLETQELLEMFGKVFLEVGHLVHTLKPLVILSKNTMYSVRN